MLARLEEQEARWRPGRVDGDGDGDSDSSGGGSGYDSRGESSALSGVSGNE
jgi:hypothetical protein